jgi:hypothetical protein
VRGGRVGGSNAYLPLDEAPKHGLRLVALHCPQIRRFSAISSEIVQEYVPSGIDLLVLACTMIRVREGRKAAEDKEHNMG